MDTTDPDDPFASYDTTDPDDPIAVFLSHARKIQADYERTLEDVSLPEEVEGFTKQRVELVQRAVKEWTHQLVDLGGRNNLLRFRDLRQGTLDLTNADAKAVSSLLQSKAIRVSALFADAEEQERVLRRCRTIHNKAKENFEERGLETLSVACGLATWDNKRGNWEPAAPVLLRQATLRPLGAAQDEFELALTDEIEVNPTLLHLLKSDFDCDCAPEELLDRVDGRIDEPWELQTVYDSMKERAKRVPGFGIAPRLVLANFAYAKLPMVRDLESAFDELVAHELIAAIAGDEQAREGIRSLAPGPGAVLSPDQTPLADEFLFLDADSSQNYAINAVLGGENMIVRGPPGTGKSQTIANLISASVARGKRVLFVAEKRAAIDAVLKRLHQHGLSELVLDLHGGVGSRRAFAQTIRHALSATRTIPRVDHSADQHRVEKRRDELNGYVEMLHEKRDPWAISVYQIRAELLGIPEWAHTDVRFGADTLQWLDGAAVQQVAEELSEFARLGGLTLAASDSPWRKSEIVSGAEVQSAFTLAEQMHRHTVPAGLAVLSTSSEQVQLPAASTIADWEPRLALWHEIAQTLSSCSEELFDSDLEALLTRMAPATAGGFTRLKASLLSGEYKGARAELRLLRRSPDKASDAVLLACAEAAWQQLQRWRELGGLGVPTAPPNLDALQATYDQLELEMLQLEQLIKEPNLADLPSEETRRVLERLVADRPVLVTLPEIHRLEASFRAAGLDDLVNDAVSRQLSEDACLLGFRFAWLRSLLDHLALSDHRVEGFIASKHDKAIDDFKTGDREHIETTALRVRRICAEYATRARDQHREQAALLQHQAGLKTRHMPVRDLVRSTSDALLALKPCWAMSPLVVSQLLPSQKYFDIVVFDEASQITPADAVASILRGSQLVVAGDEKQLPPTAFFVAENPDEEEELEGTFPVPLVAGTKGFESILDALGSLLRFRMLRWHYRSRDERLIAFSNAHMYDHMLTTFPGVGGSEVFNYVNVAWDPSADTNSPTPEVEAVVDLIIEHARIRRDESLGVIAMGIKHANRIEEALRQRLHDDPKLEDELGYVFDEMKDERFFAKNLERVQGDERDAIILTIGYGKNSRGQLVYRFGPLLYEGGERRLNVAVTRAKRRMTLVSSFSSRDMDPDRSSAEGVKLLRQYLQYVESGGLNLGDQILEKPELNPFEVDVRDTLTRSGLKLTAQYGSSGYWIDYVVQHPAESGRYVLAIECDGATYHSSESARDRDRLRQEQLERLGWRFHRIWSSDWFHNKDKAVKKALAAYRAAVEFADEEDRKRAGIDAGVNRVAVLGDSFGGDDETTSAPAPRRAVIRPLLSYGLGIDQYSQAQLVALARWIESDDLLRSEDELLEEMMRELGFRRRGSKITARLEAAIRGARK